MTEAANSERNVSVTAAHEASADGGRTAGATENAVAAIVLAAGGSRRLARPKQLIQKDGESLLRRTARLALSAGCGPVVVVLGSQAELMIAQLAGLEVEAAINRDWESGMASSVRSGLEALPQHPSKPVMILVCDQPRLTEETLAALIRAHRTWIPERPPDITASTYAGVKGVPAIFSRTVVPALMQLSGDEGARKIISNARWKVATVEFPGGTADIDLPSDLAQV
jgi:molybdenum cofactor cytidylyltransferase